MSAVRTHGHNGVLRSGHGLDRHAHSTAARVVEVGQELWVFPLNMPAKPA
jgi:hypothetical protein